MFNGFGKPQYTPDERQNIMSNGLMDLLMHEKKFLSMLNASRNQMFQLCPHTAQDLTRFKEDNAPQFISGDTPIRWDVLNPGCPDLVPMIVFTKEGRRDGTFAVKQGAANCFTALWNRATQVLTVSNQWEDEERMGMASLSLKDGKRSVIETPDRTFDAMNRFTSWNIFDMARRCLRDPNEMDQLISIVSSSLGDGWDDAFLSV